MIARHDAAATHDALATRWSRDSLECKPAPPRRVTIGVMRIASGRVVRGQIIYEPELPEGADVTLIAHDGEQSFEVSPELQAVLLEAIAQCDRGETISADELLREMRSRE